MWTHAPKTSSDSFATHQPSDVMDRWSRFTNTNRLGATNSFWLPGLPFCGSLCWHDDGEVLRQSQSSWVRVVCTRMWRHTQHARVCLKGRFLLKLEVFLLQGFLPAPGRTGQVAAPWELTEPWTRSLQMVKFLRVQQRRSRKPLRTAPIVVASLIRRRSSGGAERVPKLQGKSCPPQALPLQKENSISCVGISFSVKAHPRFPRSAGP